MVYMDNNICPRCSSEMKPLFHLKFYCPVCEPFLSEKDKQKKKIKIASDPAEDGWQIIDLDGFWVDDDPTDPNFKP